MNYQRFPVTFPRPGSDSDSYTYVYDHPLNFTDDGGLYHQFGTVHSVYEIRRKRSNFNLQAKTGYVVTVRNKVVIYGLKSANAESLVDSFGAYSQESYKNYPVILMASVEPNVNNDGRINLVRMFPRTINSTTGTSQSTSDGTNTTRTDSVTSGSSQSSVKSYGIHHYGLFKHESKSGESDQSSTMSSDASEEGYGSEASESRNDSSSVRDWSTFSIVRTDGPNPTWVWAQSNPWDVIQYNRLRDISGSNVIDLPDFVQDRLVQNGLLLPPSQMSLYGLDFTMTAAWTVEFDDEITESETISFSSNFAVYNASHFLDAEGKLVAELETGANARQDVASLPDLPLSRLALVPFEKNSDTSRTVIGFETSEFTISPATPGEFFKVVSSNNRIEVTGVGFTRTPDQASLYSSLESNTALDIYFKISDPTTHFALVMKCWLLNSENGPCRMEWTINDVSSGVMMVIDDESSFGRGKLNLLSLRNLDYMSSDFHDFLNMGNNHIHIDFKNAGSQVECPIYIGSVSIQ